LPRNRFANSAYTHALAHVLHRPAVLPVPPFGPRLLLGEQARPRTRLRQSKKLSPPALSQSGHQFSPSRTWIRRLRHLLGHVT